MATAAPKGKDIIYKTVGKLEIPLHLVLPPNPKNVPILLWFHGGGLLQGNRLRIAPHMLRAVSKFNIALVSADYRLAPQVGVADIYEDVKDCVAFIRNQLSKHAGEGSIDVGRLAISGSSAGGYLALLAGLYLEPKPKAILPIYPITDPLGSFFITPQAPQFGGPRVERETVAPFLELGAEVMASNEIDSKRNNMYAWMLQSANLAQLLKFKSGDATWRVSRQIAVYKLPPAYVVHGDADSAVGIEQADEVVGAMVGLGLEVVYERLAGTEHSFDAKDESVEMEKMYAFMMKHI